MICFGVVPALSFVDLYVLALEVIPTLTGTHCLLILKMCDHGAQSRFK